MIKLIKELILKIKKTLRLLRLQLALKKAEPNPGFEETTKRIRAIANYFEVDPALAVRVALCESSLNPKAMLQNRTGSIDRGLFQWNDFYHPEVSDKCAFNIECSTARFCQAVKSGNISWWDCSRPCWDKTYKYSG